MNESKRLSLNLATHPLRNRRLFFLLSGVLAVGLVFVLVLGVFFFVHYRAKGNDVREALSRVKESIDIAQNDIRKYSEKNKTLLQREEKKISLINSIILKKSFSWTELFAKLEKALPASSYVLSLTPSIKDDTHIDLRLKVVSGGLDALLELVDNLNALEFRRIRVEGEQRNERGELVSEISLSYERSI